MESKSDFEGLYTSALLTAKWGVVAQKRGREPIGPEKGSGTNSAEHPSGHLAIGSRPLF